MLLIFYKVKIEIAISDEMVDTVIESITRVKHREIDGKSVVTNLEQVIRIRTGWDWARRCLNWHKVCWVEKLRQIAHKNKVGDTNEKKCWHSVYL